MGAIGRAPTQQACVLTLGSHPKPPDSPSSPVYLQSAVHRLGSTRSITRDLFRWREAGAEAEAGDPGSPAGRTSRMSSTTSLRVRVMGCYPGLEPSIVSGIPAWPAATLRCLPYCLHGSVSALLLPMLRAGGQSSNVGLLPPSDSDDSDSEDEKPKLKQVGGAGIC